MECFNEADLIRLLQKKNGIQVHSHDQEFELLLSRTTLETVLEDEDEDVPKVSHVCLRKKSYLILLGYPSPF